LYHHFDRDAEKYQTGLFNHESGMKIALLKPAFRYNDCAIFDDNER
jgi:hypothetical protein